MYAHIIRTRHPLPSSARGFHMCTRPSSVKYVEYRISFLSLCRFVSLLLRYIVKNALNVDGMCVHHVYQCASITNQYTICEL